MVCDEGIFERKVQDELKDYFKFALDKEIERRDVILALQIGDEHKHNYNIPITKTVHHDAVTKVVHHDAVTRQETYTVVDQEAYDEPVYETHVVCKVCGQDFGKGSEASLNAGDHSAITGHSYHSTKVQAGTKHHDAVTHQETKTVVVTPAYDETVVVQQAYDETVTTGYKCLCGATK